MNSPETSKPGKTREALADGDVVIRVLLDQSNYDHIQSNTFKPSGDEQEQAKGKNGWMRLSVYETSLTTAKQACAMMNNPDRRAVVMLNVSDIRAISFADESSTLDVLWDRIADCIDEEGISVPGHKTGCEGHCGITGQPDGRDPFTGKVQRALSRLADSSPKQFLDAP